MGEGAYLANPDYTYSLANNVRPIDGVLLTDRSWIHLVVPFSYLDDAFSGCKCCYLAATVRSKTVWKFEFREFLTLP